MAADTPFTRTASDSWSESTSPSASPSAALSACPRMERSVSGTSSMTSTSGMSNIGNDNVVGKRRGFNRPQGTAFADSARQRDSVMSLGTIAHLQHYFARTGLLDGKGAQLAKEDQQSRDGVGLRSVSGTSQTSPHSPLSPMNESAMNGFGGLHIPDSHGYDDSSVISSPEQMPSDGPWDSPHPLSLLPTVSTYKQKSTYVPPPPNLAVLRRELREALEDARKLFQDIEADAKERGIVDMSPSKRARPDPLQGWFEIQGLQVLDLVTLAIRAAKNFYTSHEQPQRLYSIKTERKIRTELFNILEVLKKLANRNFAGGSRLAERNEITKWITGIDDLVTRDEEAEKLEHEQMRRYDWQEAGWEGRERQREWLFLKSFDTSPDTLAEWTIPIDQSDAQPSAFLRSLQDGRRLVLLHNELVRKSRRQFETIKTFHTDVAKPYRCAENLRYWIKAAALRWDAHLDVDVPAVVRGESVAAWLGFDAALLKWCRKVREEITREWQDHHEALKKERPIVRIHPGNEMPLPW